MLVLVCSVASNACWYGKQNNDNALDQGWGNYGTRAVCAKPDYFMPHRHLQVTETSMHHLLFQLNKAYENCIANIVLNRKL